MPYEVRGGIALHASELWPFVQDVQRLELACFGAVLHQFKKELKGCKLLDKDRFKFAAQGPQMSDEERRKHSRGFLTKGLEKKPPARAEFTAYGQACLEMVRGMFELLRDHKAKLFAAAIPRSIVRPSTFEAAEFLRKDQVFLLERFFYFLEQERHHGLLVMDEVEKTEDRRFVTRLESYFAKTQTGRFRSSWIVPTPFFVSSDMAYPVQAAESTTISWRSLPRWKCVPGIRDSFRARSVCGTLSARKRRQRQSGHPKAALKPSLRCHYRHKFATSQNNSSVVSAAPAARAARPRTGGRSRVRRDISTVCSVVSAHVNISTIVTAARFVDI